MKDYSFDELNEISMSIILHAGECRKYLEDAVDSVDTNDNSKVDELLKLAKSEITAAHKIHTEFMQSTIMNENQRVNILFTHAQDTLMTVNSEWNVTKNMLKLFRKMSKNEK